MAKDVILTTSRARAEKFLKIEAKMRAGIGEPANLAIVEREQYGQRGETFTAYVVVAE